MDVYNPSDRLTAATSPYTGEAFFFSFPVHSLL